MTVSEEGKIEIDTGREALFELLSLNIQRMKEYRREETPEYGAYFENLFGYILRVREGEDAVMASCGKGPFFSFWEEEAGRLTPGSAELYPERFLSVTETSLLLLSMVHEKISEGSVPTDRDGKEILYSYVSDYAPVFLTEYVTGKCRMPSLLTDFLFDRKPETEARMSLFWGDRLRSRVVDALTGLKKEEPEAFSRIAGKFSLSLPEEGSFTPHQKKVFSEYAAKVKMLFLLALCALSVFSACGKEAGEEAAPEEAAESLSALYPGLCEVKNADGTTRDIFGIMHALCLEVQPGEKSGLYVYTLCDREDPENAWSIESRFVGDIVAEVEKGSEVAVLFSGNIVEDPDNVEFVAFLPEKKYSIKSASGKVINNMMTSFTLRTKTGTELTFVKDNCKVDRDALSTESGGEVLVYYADSGSLTSYPFRVYNENGK